MSDLWFPGTDRSRPARVDGGSILGGAPKCLWHDTETLGVPGYSTDFWPNMTLDPRTGRTWQHIPADRAARALRNESGGVQTNRWNVFQIEVLGFVNKVPFHPVMAEVARWLHEVRGTPLRATVDWLPYDASFGNSRVRLSDAAWSSYAGHLAHMHAPENVHGDPGWPFPISQIIAGEEDDMSAEAEAQIKDIHDGMVVPGTTNVAQAFELLFNRVKAIQDALIVPGTTNAEDAVNMLFSRVRTVEAQVTPDDTGQVPLAAAVAQDLAGNQLFVRALAEAIAAAGQPPPSPPVP